VAQGAIDYLNLHSLGSRARPSYASHVTPDVIALDSGDLMMMFRLLTGNNWVHYFHDNVLGQRAFDFYRYRRTGVRRASGG
jgi:hypothetical protein